MLSNEHPGFVCPDGSPDNTSPKFRISSMGTAYGLGEEYGISTPENLVKGLAYVRVANSLEGFCKCTDTSLLNSKQRGCGAFLANLSTRRVITYYDKYIINNHCVATLLNLVIPQESLNSCLPSDFCSSVPRAGVRIPVGIPTN